MLYDKAVNKPVTNSFFFDYGIGSYANYLSSELFEYPTMQLMVQPIQSL